MDGSDAGPAQESGRRAAQPVPAPGAALRAGVGMLSRRLSLYPEGEDDPIGRVEQALGGAKGMLAESGWVFLANDTNDFMRLQFGPPAWTEEQRARAAAVIDERARLLRARRARYRKFIIPEKSVVYAEYLPRALAKLPRLGMRPAEMLAADRPQLVRYLARYLIDAKSYGPLYFRGDTHTNWIGSYFVYRHIAETLAADRVIAPRDLLRLGDMQMAPAQYSGDILGQIPPEHARLLRDTLGFLHGTAGYEMLIEVKLPAAASRVERRPVPPDYAGWFRERETLIYEAPPGSRTSRRPRAVIFRDSTLDNCHEWLAQHFSRSVFVWFAGQVFEEVLDRERPDVVLHVMAERFVTRYPDWPPIDQVARYRAPA
ncbi:MAG TPA: hypothetical protein VME92_07975 [Acetobacteraceae bacterium]|nr:hypothetical protein [Acetobacteraceae bacterium]